MPSDMPPTFPSQSMREDWNRRAVEDHRLHIAAGHTATEEDFLESGEQDLTNLVLDGVTLQPEAAALEIGCGVGRLLVPLARRVARVRGVDISPVMVEKSLAYTATTPNVVTELTDGTLAGIPSKSLDFVFSFIVFQHIPAKQPIQKYVAEAARVLKPGGVFRFQVDGRWWWGEGSHTPDTYNGIKFSPRAARRLVAGTSLTLVDDWGAEGHYHWVTSRKSGTGASVTARPRSWDLYALAAVLRRLGAEHPEEYSRRLKAKTQSLRPALTAFVERNQALDADAFVEAAFIAFFGSVEDSRGRAFHTNVLNRGFEDRMSLLDTIATSRGFLDQVRPFVPMLPWYVAYEILGRLGVPLKAVDFYALSILIVNGLPTATGDAVTAAFRVIFSRQPDSAALAHHIGVAAGRVDGRYFLVRSLLMARLEEAGLGTGRPERGFGSSTPAERHIARRALESGVDVSDDAFVQLAYRRILGRDADVAGRLFYSERLTSGELSRPMFLAQLFRSNERQDASRSLARRLGLLLRGAFGR